MIILKCDKCDLNCELKIDTMVIENEEEFVCPENGDYIADFKPLDK